jgi:uncharacterized repeat protein (TIGR03803 family)
MGGTDDKGVLFKYDSGITILNMFTDGIKPRCLTINGSLYGITIFGGTTDNGTVFKYELSTPIISSVCFPAGTLITTDQGDIEIDKINPLTTTIHKKAIRAITRTILPDPYVVCIYKDALGINYPDKTTIISKNHKIMYDGKLTKVCNLIGRYKNIQPIAYTKETMYNVLLDSYYVMKVNNLTCETLHPENTVAKMYLRIIE